MKKILSAVLLSSAISAPVLAEGLDFENKYLTASVVSGNYDISGFDRTTGVAVALGIPFKGASDKKSSALEVGYANIGDSEGDFNTTLSATSLFVVGKYGFEVAPKTDVFAKVGLNSFTAKAENSFASAEESEIKLMYGFGAEYDLSDKVVLGADYTSYEADTTAIGVNLSFKL